MTAEQYTDPEKSRWWSRYTITVEPIIAVLFTVTSIGGPPLTDLVMRQGCRMYGMERQECIQHKEVEIEVHRISADFQLYSVVIHTLPGCLISLFTSPWSETNGRKPALLISLTGVTLAQGLTTWMSTIEDIHPYTLLLAGLPSVTGGSIVVLLSIYCYLIDITEKNDRSIRYSIMVTAGLCSQIIGSLVSPTLVSFGYPVVFGLGTVLLILLLIYCICILPESVKVQEDKRRNLFTVEHLIESFRTFFKKRPHGTRGIIFTVTLMSLFTVMMSVGEAEVRYQALIKVFQWNIVDFSQYNVLNGCIIFVSTFGGVYVGTTLLGIDELKLVLGFQLLATIGSFLMAWAPTPMFYLLVAQLRCFLQCAVPLASGAISKTIDQSDVAKVVSFMGTLDSFTPQLGTLIYSAFYHAVVGIYPFSIYLLSCGFGIVASICVIIALVLRKRAASSSAV